MMIASPKAEILLDTQRGRTRHVMTLELQNILSGHLSCLLFLSLLYSFFFFFWRVGWIVLPEEEGMLIYTHAWVLNLRKPGGDKRKPYD